MARIMRLRYRLFLGYAVTVVLFVASALIVYSTMRTMERLDDERKQVHVARLTTANLESELFKVQGASRGLILIKHNEVMDRWADAAKEVQKLCESLDRNIRDPKARASLQALNDEIRKFMDFNAGMLNLVKEGKSEAAAERFKTTGIGLGGQLRAKLSPLEQGLDELYALAQASAADARTNVYRALIGGVLLAVFFSVGAGLWIIRSAGQSVGQATGTMSSAAKEIAATVTQHERAAFSQAAMVNETTATTDELKASFRMSAEQAGAVVEVAQRASGFTEEGRAIVGEAIHGMSNLKDKVGSVADQILRLGEQTAQIGNIANVVKDLAGQTNMLALNAAVEAVRAGDHGKGFGVVAGEVRKLADQSKKSAEEAYRIVSEIQKASNSTIMVTEESMKTVDEVAHIARKVGELFEGLSAEASRVYENAQQVVLNSKQQSSAINQIAEAMTNINASSKETAAGITQTKQGLQDLEDAARRLQDVV
ncbi:MAG: methyl-accepting chemotaxis protein [Thermodesulfobacteriota bacterium]